MDLSAVDALLDVFGPFLFPVALFVAGVVGYGVLLFAGRLLEGGETAGTSEDAADTERFDG